MPKREKFLLFVLLSCLILSACTPHPPDVFVFENLAQRISTDPVSGHLILTPSPTCMKQVNEPECGHGVAIVSGQEIYVGEGKEHQFKGKPWSILKQQSVYVPAAESYAPLSTYIVDSCKKMGCDDQIDEFKAKLDSLGQVGVWFQ